MASMMALEEQDNEREGPSINRSSFDVENFCQRHLKCKECSKSYVDPIMLSCLHTYCPDCLKKRAAEKKRREPEERAAGGEEDEEDREGNNGEEGMGQIEEEEEEEEGEADAQEVEDSYVPNIHIVYGNENLTAPHDCDAGIEIGDGDDVQDPVSRPLSNIINAAKLKEKLPQGKMECRKCKKDIAKWICSNKECSNIPLCDLCHESHKREQDTEDHEVIKVDPEKDWWKGMNRQTWHCSEHPKFLVDMYCFTHDTTMCLKCCPIYHNSPNCRNVDVHKCYSRIYNKSREEQQKVEMLKDTYKDAENRGENVKRSLETKRDDVIAALNERYDQLVQQLTVERDEAIEKANLICDLKKKEIDDHQAVLKRVTETLEDSLEFIKDFSNIANPAEFMFLKFQLTQRLDYLHDRYSKFDLSPADDDELYLEPSNDDLPANILGIVRSTPCVKKFEIKNTLQKSDGGLYITIERRDIAGSHVPVSMPLIPNLKAVVTPENGEIGDGVTCEVRFNRGNGCYLVSVPASEDGGNKNVHIYQHKPYPHKQYYIRGGPFKFNSAPPSKSILPWIRHL